VTKSTNQAKVGQDPSQQHRNREKVGPLSDTCMEAAIPTPHDDKNGFKNMVNVSFNF
jgi:hypothetical protein